MYHFDFNTLRDRFIVVRVMACEQREIRVTSLSSFSTHSSQTSIEYTIDSDRVIQSMRMRFFIFV